ncbi:hypothetical protein B0A48_17202 [Cryoendolithus antarcticus]|uniref:N-acetyltransferase domain-containing protein n=1 Tax=Cryoendolithus antarcticus TaxID=1507870 RepID=A0A1V8SD82_9PEZI|nr:hypothetical protein B0A48_17202 [Cryoendolithus antarcticus]
MPDNISLRDATIDDAPAIAAIYNHYVRESLATLAEDAMPDTPMQQRVQTLCAAKLPFLVAVDQMQNGIAGYAYASPYSDRSGCAPTLECSIYLHPDHCSKGIGRQLMDPLISALVSTTTKTQVLAKMSILPDQSPESLTTCRLHASMGFRQVGRLDRVGFKLGKWVDVVMLQLDLEALRK